MKFIHAADLHIDSPLVGLRTYEGAPAERLRDATRQALRNLTTLAIEEQAVLVLVAGDMFDGQWRDMQTGLFTAREFRRLRDAGIGLYFLRGNHDAESQVRKAIQWPDNVREFSVAEAETIALEGLGFALHGRGFEQRSVTFDPVAGYPAALKGMLNIGVLHTNLDGSADHDPYAPTSLASLESKGYDYWALGHIHKRQMHAGQSYIAYSGNTQGRHVRETGAKGCLVVTAEDGRIEDVEFRATDAVRWFWTEVQSSESDDAEDLIDNVEQKLRICHAEAEDRLAAVRLSIRGRSAAHARLADPGQRARAEGEIRNRANALDEEVWIEEIRWETAPLVDLEQLRSGNDLVGELLREIRDVRCDPPRLAAMAAELAALEKQFAQILQEANIDIRSPQQLERWMAQAELLLVDQLVPGDAG